MLHSRPLVISLCRLVVALPLVAPPSHLLVVPRSRPLVLFSRRHPLVVSLRRLVVASPLVTPPSCPLNVLSLRHHLVVLRWLVVVLPLVAPPSLPLIALPSRLLIARRLIVAWPPSNDAAAIKHPPAFAATTAVAAARGGTATNVVELTIVHCQNERGSTTSGGSVSTHVHNQDSGQIRPERISDQNGSRVPAHGKGGTSGMLRPDSARIWPEQESCPGFWLPKNWNENRNVHLANTGESKQRCNGEGGCGGDQTRADEGTRVRAYPWQDAVPW